MVRILLGRAGSGKSAQILKSIRENGQQRKQILLVPEHASYQAEVDLCRECGDTVSSYAEVLSFRRLCDRVFHIDGGLASVTLDPGGKLLMLQKSVTEIASELKVYCRPPQRVAFLQQMLDLFDELRSYDVSPKLFQEKVQGLNGATRDKLYDLSLLYANYEVWLNKSGMEDRMTMLCEKLKKSEYVADKDIYIDGFSYFTAQEYRVLEIMLREAHGVTIALLGEKNDPEPEGIFESSYGTVDRLLDMAEKAGEAVDFLPLVKETQGALNHLEFYFFRECVPYKGESSAVRILEADNVFSEVEQTAAEIQRLVLGGHCRYRDIKVAARKMDDYENTIKSVFERYGIPLYYNQRSEILEQPIVSLLSGVLASVENGYEYEDMFRWLKTGLGGLSLEECDILENYVLKWDIHGNMWIRESDWVENPDGYGMPMGARQEDYLKQINILRNRVGGPLRALSDGLKSSGTGADKVEALYAFAERISLRNSLEQQMYAQTNAGDAQEATKTAQLWEILCGILDQFVETLGDEPMKLEEFSRLFRLALTQYSVGTIPVLLDSVSASEITRNDRHRAKYLFLLGVNDHVLPSNGESQGILTNDDRDALWNQGIKLAPFGIRKINLEMQNLYAALAQASEGLVISYPVADVSGNELRPAFVVSRVLSLFPELKVEKEGNDKLYRLAAKIPALEMAGQPSGANVLEYLKQDGESKTQKKISAMMRASTLKRGALSRAAVRALYGERIAMSASRLERLRSCHFAYFMEYGLRVKPRTAAAFDAPQIGTFLHFLLENTTREVLAQGGFAQMEDEALHTIVRKYIDLYVEQELPNFEEKNDRFKYLFNRLRNTAYAVIDQVAEEMRHSDFVPLEFELSFGDRGTLPAVTITEPDVELRIGGKVDRVDGWIKDDKLYLRVVDYKSGRKTFDLAAVRMGLDIQMLLYLFTLQKEGTAHFGKEIEPAGVLYLPARDDILSAERNILPDKLLKEREKNLKRSGLLLAEPAVLQAMEHDSLTEPHYLPLRVSKDGNLSGSIASAAQLGKLGQYVDKLLHQIAEEIRQGNIDADPCCHNENDSFCQYCDWADACYFKDGRDGDHLHYILPVKAEEFWKSLEEEGGVDV